tara:strand:- start:1497 stop:2093 length:597 start_codon:yes stop_codon:yes gene_type:complete
MKPLLIIFCKNLIAGRVKTRLANSIGNKKALLIYQKLIERTKRIVLPIENHKIIYYSDFIDHKDNWSNFVNEKKIQKGNNLGERMLNAFADGFRAYYSPIILIGSDLWDLNYNEINYAFKQLKNNDYIFGPSIDGGYYLIGMKKLNHNLFENKTWSSSFLLKETLQDINSKKIFLLESKNDIDTIEDLILNKDLKTFI